MPIEWINTPAMTNFMRTLITQDFLSSQIHNIINEIFDFLGGKTSTLDLAWDLSPIKQEFQGPQQDILLHELVKALPVCKEGHEFKLEESSMPMCKPDFIKEDILVELMHPVVPQILGNLPDKISLSEGLEESLVNLHPAGIALNQTNFNIAVGILAVLILFIWFITALIGGVNWHERLLWLGWTLFIPTLLFVALGMVLHSDLSTVLIHYGMDKALPHNIGLDDTLNAAIISISRFVIDRTSKSFLTTSCVTGIVSILLIAIGAIMHSARKKAPQLEDE